MKGSAQTSVTEGYSARDLSPEWVRSAKSGISRLARSPLQSFVSAQFLPTFASTSPLSGAPGKVSAKASVIALTRRTEARSASASATSITNLVVQPRRPGRPRCLPRTASGRSRRAPASRHRRTRPGSANCSCACKTTCLRCNQASRIEPADPSGCVTANHNQASFRAFVGMLAPPAHEGRIGALESPHPGCGPPPRS